MSIRVDSFIIAAIREYISVKKISAKEFASEMKISPAAVTKWTRVGNGITDAKWSELFPKIKPYLPKDRIYIDDSGSDRYSSATANVSEYVFEPKYVPQMVYAIPLRVLSRYNNILESVAQLGMRICARMIEYHPKHANKSGVMAVEIENNLYAPVLPQNTRLFVCTGGETIGNGYLCIAKDSSGDVHIGYYRVRRDQFAVIDLITEKPLIIGTIDSAKKVMDWIFPVLYYEVTCFP